MAVLWFDVTSQETNVHAKKTQISLSTAEDSKTFLTETAPQGTRSHIPGSDIYDEELCVR